MSHENETHEGIIKALQAQAEAMQKSFFDQTEDLKASQLVNADLRSEKLTITQNLTVEMKAHALAMKAREAEIKLSQVQTNKFWISSCLCHVSIRVELSIKALVHCMRAGCR